MKTMISVEDALKRILDSISPLGLEKVNILDALGRVIGEDIHAGRDIPPKDNSAMDGYALRAEDTRGHRRRGPFGSRSSRTSPPGQFPGSGSDRGRPRGS